MKQVSDIVARILLTLTVLPAVLAAQSSVIETIKPSVVKVSKSVWESDPISGVHRHDWGGSGVIVGIDRGRTYILTNRHVADEAWHAEGERWCEVDPYEVDCSPEFVKEQTIVTFADGQTSRAVLHWRSPCADLALLEAPYTGNSVRPAAIEGAVKVGEEAFALGHPLGLEYTLTKGIVSAKRRLLEGACVYEAIQTDANINPGNSGGGLFNSHGRLVGINTWKAGEGLGFAVSIAHYLRELGQDPRRFVHEHKAALEGRVSTSGETRAVEPTTKPNYVGGDVSAPIPIYKPEPPYTNEARAAGVNGVVGLWIMVEAKGNVSQIRVVKPLGYGLDEKAMETVRTWKFRPAMRNGLPVAVPVTVEVSFQLKK